MSRPRLPRPGDILNGDDAEWVVVIQRGWTDAQIRSSLIEAFGCTLGDGFTYEIDTWRYHTKTQAAYDGQHGEHEAYWSPDGAGMPIEVALAVPTTL